MNDMRDPETTKVTIELPTEFINELAEAVTTAVTSAVTAKVKAQKPNDGYMSLIQATKYLSVSRATLNRWILEQGLHVSIIKGVKRIKRSDADKFMQLNNY